MRIASRRRELMRTVIFLRSWVQSFVTSFLSPPLRKVSMFRFSSA